MNGNNINIYIILLFKWFASFIRKSKCFFIKVDFSSKMHMTQLLPGFFVEKNI